MVVVDTGPTSYSHRLRTAIGAHSPTAHMEVAHGKTEEARETTSVAASRTRLKEPDLAQLLAVVEVEVEPLGWACCAV